MKNVIAILEYFDEPTPRLVGELTVDAPRGSSIRIVRRPGDDRRYTVVLVGKGPRKINADTQTLLSFVLPPDSSVPA